MRILRWLFTDEGYTSRLAAVDRHMSDLWTYRYGPAHLLDK